MKRLAFGGNTLVCSLVGATLLALPGCYQGAHGPGGEDADETADGTGDGDADTGEQAELPAPSARFYRLTHAQWENTVQDLFRLPAPTGLSELFRDDPQVAGFVFDNDVTALEVDSALWTGYRLAAADVAQQVTEDPARLADLMPPDGGTMDERIDAFAREFGRRAYRRPLTDPEVDELATLFSAAPGLYSDVADPFVAGIRHVVETVLQSPHFLYRIERSTQVVDDVIPLDDWEVAQRLSYFLWNTMPDEALFSAAEDGALVETAEVETQALRLVEDPRAGEVVRHFHAQLLDVAKFAAINPSDNFFPDAPATLAELAEEENERFVRDIVFGEDGGLRELLTSTETFVNAELAGVYGLEGSFDDTFVHAQLDESQRRGVFTQVGFLASNATSVDPDPIHRGVFMARRMSCLQIAAPPDGVPPLPPIEPDQTNRERVEAHTQQAGTVCVNCHATMINPYGFPYENYDAMGAWRTTDNGKPVDASSTVLIGKEFVDVENALELADAMAQSQAVHECYIRHWIEYAAGRPSTSDDDAATERLGAASLDEQQSIKDLLIGLATSKAFLNRAVEELP